MLASMATAKVDGRRERGARTRRAVGHQAAALASVHGLTGLSIGQVADALGVGKSSVQAAYATKEELQLGAVATATEVFVGAVVTPAMAADEGLPRLAALVDTWLDYVGRRVFPGGCFMVATLAEIDSQPGPVRDALTRARRDWLGLLTRQATVAQRAGDLPPSPPADMVAFEVDAVLGAANVARNLSDDLAHLTAARGLLAERLGLPAPTRPRRGRLTTRS